MMFTVNDVLENHYPAVYNNTLLTSLLKPILRHLLREQDFHDFADAYPHLRGMDFVEQVLEKFNFSYTVSGHELENIPPVGRVVIIANHPIGSLDGLALLKMVNEIRSDVRIVANEMLMHISPLHPCMLPVNNMTGNSARDQLRHIDSALQNEEAIIIFPAGEVSRLSYRGIKDSPWQRGFINIAKRAKAPILPIYISGSNSPGFYTASLFYKPLATALLVQEMFKQQKKQIKLTIGKIIPAQSYLELRIHSKNQIKLFRKHLYGLGKGKKEIFHTETTVARAERRADLKKELEATIFLGQTPDGKKIFLSATDHSPVLIRELGRLREITFRAVGEGTGKRRDIDRFDSFYQHLILWDETDLEIVGSYRLTDAAVSSRENMADLYTDSLFRYDKTRHPFLQNGLELGRSFVQRRYWGRRSLDYLWFGIGAFLANNPDYRYLFGPVSISNSMPLAAKELLIAYYRLYFSPVEFSPCSRNHFNLSSSNAELTKEFSGRDRKKDFKTLKTMLANLGSSVPTLYKQYAELCETGGVSFLDFNVDPDFNNCVDGLVVVDLNKLKAKKRQRYIQNSILTGQGHLRASVNG